MDFYIYKRNVELELTCYSDADFANDEKLYRFRTGIGAILGSGAITWVSQKQQTSALSTTKAEYRLYHICTVRFCDYQTYGD